MFYSNVRHQSIIIYKFWYKLYFLVNIGYYRILSTHLICLAEIGKVIILGKVWKFNSFCFTFCTQKWIFLKIPGFTWANFLICSTYIIYQCKKLKIGVDKVGQNFFWSRKIFFMKYIFKKSHYFLTFFAKNTKKSKF